MNVIREWVPYEDEVSCKNLDLLQRSLIFHPHYDTFDYDTYFPVVLRR